MFHLQLYITSEIDIKGVFFLILLYTCTIVEFNIYVLLILQS